LGELLDVMDKYDLWKDTMLIFTTDHGYHLGEHGYMGKNFMADYNEVYHIPMIVCHPDLAAGRCDALTQNIDVLPTVMEYYDIPETVIPYNLHGKSLLPLLRGETASIHESVIYGYFGHEVAINDGRYTYIRASKDETNRPLNVYTAMPTMLRQYIGGDDGCLVADYDKIEMGRYLSWTNYPVYKFPADIVDFKNWSQTFAERREFNERSLLFDLETDYRQEHPIEDEALERQMEEKLRKALHRFDSPAEQFERLGL
ncbi:MAG: sulfatase/phosphatase domain-containing protein, partial [Butyricicoccus sp.]